MPSPSAGISVCLSCRLKLLARLHPRLTLIPSIQNVQSFASRAKSNGASKGQCRALYGGGSRMKDHADTHMEDTAPAGSVEESLAWVQHRFPPPLVGTINGQSKLARRVRSNEERQDLPKEGRTLEEVLTSTTPEDIAREARQQYGDRLPLGILDDQQYKVYERLYGVPLPEETIEAIAELQDESPKKVLLREGTDGKLEEVEYAAEDSEPLLEEKEEDYRELEDGEKQSGRRKIGKRGLADDHLSRDIQITYARSTIRAPDDAASVVEERELDDEADFEADSQTVRTHPFTAAARSATIPTTLSLPQDGFTGPVSLLLADLSNKHIDESAARIFGGRSLPYGNGTPRTSLQLPQKPIPLSASQARMTEMEADLYMAAVMPGTYAAVMSVLVELRRRLGSEWLENLMKKEGGPRILDVGAGGAGVLAWREVIKAEWERMHPQEDNNVNSEFKNTVPPAPLGKAVVLTGSGSLRQRASVLLENTTFIPRLPDYVHTNFEKDAQRKRFDLIVAPHSLWHLQEDFERKQRVLNLWNLLDPQGGVLVLLEKGVPRGFEIVADARDYLLGELFERTALLNKDETQKDSNILLSLFDADTAPSTKSKSIRESRRAPGRIIAPCTSHTKCPMYQIPGISRQRKDYCHFSQRYVRPAFLQRILGAKDRNHEDVRFSYIAVQKGTAWDAENAGFLIGEEATKRAFMGYDLDDQDIIPSSIPTTTTGVGLLSTAAIPSPSHFHHPLSRLILPPLKRQGHIILDVCTPSGTLERWTVTKSFGKQAYRDARKSKWGDLWALGAKLRMEKRVRLGWGHLEKGIGTGRGAEAIAETVKVGGKDIARGPKGTRGGQRESPIIKGPIKDIAGRVVRRTNEQGEVDGDPTTDNMFGSLGSASGVDANGETSKERRIKRRREETEKGRLKARRRRREETKEIYGRGRGD